jgi:hypothetical protein
LRREKTLKRHEASSWLLNHGDGRMTLPIATRVSRR